jgi:cell division protein FtsX
MKWAERARKILESPRARTDITDISGVKGASVGSVGATCKAFSEKNGKTWAEVPLSFNPLPGRYWLDPVDNGFLPSSKTMTDLSECRGYPEACQRCRLLMADLETCLLGPEGGTA